MTASRSSARLAEYIRLCRRRRVSRELYAAERGWRFSPGDGGDPTVVSELAFDRELMIMQQALGIFGGAHCSPGLAGKGLEGKRERALAFDHIAHELKFFPVMFISAPHLEESVAAAFPGIPTPLLYATSVLDRHLRIDEFPARRVPEVVAVMNPPRYDQHFCAEFAQALRRHRPRVVGISNVSEGHHYCLRIAEQVKELLPEAIVLVGGAHEDGTNPEVYRSAAERARSGGPCLAPGLGALGPAHIRTVEALQTLARGEERGIIDFVAAGDGPYLVMEFMRLVAEHERASVEELKSVVRANAPRFAELEGSGNLFFCRKGGGGVEHVRLSGRPLDRNRLPFIHLGKLTHENRFPIFRGKRTAQVMTCFGCKYACRFCHESADQALYDVPKLQRRRPENVAQELDLLVEQGYTAVFFDDSTFTQDRWHVHELTTLIAERARARWRAPLEWGCQTTLNDVDVPILAKMAAAGCTYVYFGLESVAPGDAVHKARKRPRAARGLAWAERLECVATWCRDNAIRMGISLQFGLGETASDRNATIALIAHLRRKGYVEPGCVALNVNAPYPGTHQWIDLLLEGRPLPDYRQRLVRHPSFETAHQFSSLDPRTANAILADVVTGGEEAVFACDREAV